MMREDLLFLSFDKGGEKKRVRKKKDFLDVVDDYLARADWRIRENSNMSFSLQGLNCHIMSTAVADYWLDRIYPPHVKEMHRSGDFHIHDLGMLSVYCVGWDLMDLLRRGFGGVPGKVEAAPPRHFRTALGQVVNFFYTLQGESAGAQAFSNFDTLLAPFVRYDRLTYREVKQALQEFLFNMNIPTRVGFQSPFTNLTFDLSCPSSLENVGVIVGGEIQAETYGEFQEEMDMINRAFCELMMAGDARGRIFTFPIPTYNITSDFDWESERLMPLWEMTRRYGIPYFANFVNSDLSPDDVRSMCCRLNIDHREIQRRVGGLFSSAPLTGSVGVVTLNLPRVAFLASSVEDFYVRLERLVDVAVESLEIKREVIERLTERGLYPYAQRYLADIKGRTGSYWAHHFSTVGLVGMNEACENFLGVSILHPEGREFAVEVLGFLREKIFEVQRSTRHLYNLEATPAESTAYRLARLDKARFPEIRTAGSETTPYYTNSVHPPVGAVSDVFDLLEHQDDLQVLFTGGTVVHLFIGEEIPDPCLVRDLVRTVVENFRLPYFSITPTFSVCPVHGYLPGKHVFCPHPHTEEELAHHGVEALLPESFLEGLSEGAFREKN